MKKDIILAGVGGQGILSIAAIIGYAAVETGLHLKQAEVHGMSQRGGDVQSHLRLSDKPIFSDLVPLGAADLILAVEPLEALRYWPYLNSDGWVVVNSTPFKNIPDYPETESILAEIAKLPNHIIIDADKTAKELETPRSMNMVMLGAAIPFLGLDYEKLKAGTAFIFGRKGEKVVEMNLKAIAAGYEFSENER
ncbi:MAG: indolepyruvate oxidoreductase subunit beta [Candidatus Cloacimonetes bacterium]|nr:indolepyruvate oxidoreductase subunit beta [Candidatus Cloacimonadota bacterium]